MDRKFGRALQAAEKESFSFGVDYSVESYLAYQGIHLSPALRRQLVSLYHPSHRLLRLLREDGRRSHCGLCRNPRPLPLLLLRDADWLYFARPDGSHDRRRPMPPVEKPSTTKSTPPLGHDAFLVQKEPQTELIREFLL